MAVDGFDVCHDGFGFIQTQLDALDGRLEAGVPPALTGIDDAINCHLPTIPGAAAVTQAAAVGRMPRGAVSPARYQIGRCSTEAEVTA